MLNWIDANQGLAFTVGLLMWSIMVAKAWSVYTNKDKKKDGVNAKFK